MILLGLLPLLPAGGAAWAQPACEVAVARLVSAEGPVELERGTAVRPVALDDALCPGDLVRVGPRGRAALALADGGVLRLDQGTTLRVTDGGAGERSLLDLFTGALHFLSRSRRALEIGTPFVNAAVEGTEFLLRVAADRAQLAVFEGRVRFENPLGRLTVASGEAAEAEAGRAPVPLPVAVRPRDAVRWTLYYPPVLTPLAAPGRSPEALPPALAEAAAAAGRGELAAAFERLERVPEPERDATFHALRAGLLLSGGRADEAQAAIERALTLRPGAAEALALRAVIAVAQDDRERALADARRALELAPDSAAAALALSYALQARFELGRARDVLAGAVERHPDDPLLRARLAELWLALGYVGEATEQAEAAAALGPELGRAQTVRGFVALARLDTGAARAAFERAIGLEPAAPLPHLGLGLALIRENDLAEGRRRIEIAAGLDPGDALLRSYLGKAYFEEGDDGAATAAFATAQALDPRDPTAFFYDALREQLQNRPVEALRDLETAIALNDNRAVYRSRLLLDQDRAARSVSLARVYDDLGFDQLAVREAARSLTIDPANASAHRFLSDAYGRQPRQEVARVSELLQAQLLQPLNANPVPPRLAVADLNVAPGAGPAEVGFNEFTPLFERGRPRLLLSGLAGDDDGNENTFGGEAVLSGLTGRFAYSLGGFHSQTDGFRPNSDIENTLVNAFGQAQLTPEIGVQAEYRRRETEHGDLRLNFDPEVFTERRREIDQDVGRLGLHYAPTPRSDVIASLIYARRDEATDLIFGGVRAADIDVEDDGYQAEAQYLFRSDRFNVRAGVGGYDVDVRRRIATAAGESDLSFERQQQTVYVYTGLALLPNVVATLGLSHDSFEEGAFELNRLNPKAGLEWAITDDLHLRLVAMRTLKRALVVDQTIEPTEVAGFSQFFDDANGTVADRYGIGLDARLTRGLYAGVELSTRDVDFPLTIAADAGAATIEDQQEDLYRAYLYWTPHPNWAFGAEASFERFERDETAFDPDRPLTLETTTIPLGARYFGPRGFFAGLTATYVHQEVDRQIDALEGREDFVVIDADLGYRFPDRRGIISLEAKNLLDEEFRFQDDNFRRPDERLPRFIPARVVLARLTLSF